MIYLIRSAGFKNKDDKEYNEYETILKIGQSGGYENGLEILGVK